MVNKRKPSSCRWPHHHHRGIGIGSTVHLLLASIIIYEKKFRSSISRQQETQQHEFRGNTFSLTLN
ncbi:hypothetical protein DERP_002791 [Dermatophagoides pteronyssinus]|uniref:Uncharacterized protein n=1 Tax=Dermatophagoides pteronyssinus TaxID=6956 RepID=A0ABQ8JVT9_DERPT|nr:hypothetical protein DERP_002791 [Dermatophagoides pteronyssinus]